MEIIVPAAGLSSRFQNMPPKYLLADYKKKLMIESAIKPYLEEYNITIGILQEHEEKYNATKHIKAYLGDSIRIIVLEKLTKGPADTVYQLIKKANIDENSPILVKDCDSFFDHEISFDNYVCVSKISDHEILKKLYSKSFVVANDQSIIQNIIEKKVVSDTFCVGGYAFRTAGLFCKSFEKVNIDKEVFVSHVIQYCIQEGEIFNEKFVEDYIDVGTAVDWFEYNDRPVIFCDIDGTIVRAQAHGDWHLSPTIIQKNVDRLLEFYKKGAQFIFTTARPEIAKKDTEQMLRGLGFTNFQCIYGLQNARRILVNDYNYANPYPRAEAVNIFRDADNLGDFL